MYWQLFMVVRGFGYCDSTSRTSSLATQANSAGASSGLLWRGAAFLATRTGNGVLTLSLLRFALQCLLYLEVRSKIRGRRAGGEAGRKRPLQSDKYMHTRK